MQSVKPVQITYRHLRSSDELTGLVEREARHLMAHRPPIVSVRVAVELPHHSRHKGTPVLVKVEVGVPGRTLVVGARHADARAAVHEAFDEAERVVRSHHGRQRRTRQRVWSPWVVAVRTI
jgi:ribosome-associated translation inhibitor RaiA